MTVERVELAPGLDVSRVLTGLWQIADMERDGRTLDLERTAEAMQPYVDAGLVGFDLERDVAALHVEGRIDRRGLKSTAGSESRTSANEGEQ